MQSDDQDSNFHLPNHLGSFTSLSPHSSEFDGSDSDEEPEGNLRDPLSRFQDIIPVLSYSSLTSKKTAPKNHNAVLFASVMTALAGSKLLLNGYAKEEPTLVTVGAGIVGAGLLMMYNLYNNAQPARITNRYTASSAHRRTPTPT